MIKPKTQRGHIWRVGKSWFGRWYREELERGPDGNFQVVRRQHAEKLAEYCDSYRAKKDVQPLLDAKLRRLNEGRSSPESTLSIKEYAETFFLPYCDRELKPSTSYGYRQTWRMYLKPRLATVVLRDFRCVEATELLAAIHSDHGIGRKTLGHCKNLLSAIFSFAIRRGVLDDDRLNPITRAELPRAASVARPTHAYTAQEILAMLNVLTGAAKTPMALMFFAGLRPGEARAVKWTDYDEKKKTLHVGASMWRKHITLPKTAESCASVPVADVLGRILTEAPRVSEFILATAGGKPIDLHNLAFRVIRPALALCAECQGSKKEHEANVHAFKPLPEWRGFYACRRGCATLAASLDTQLAAKSLLRHSNIATTGQYYIKSIPAEAVRAAEKMNELFETTANEAVN
jgi:integrase